MIITLTGFMGCGKSSVGRRLSELLCRRFMDLDEIVEQEQGRSIPEIFAAEGEQAFRRMELEALKRIVDGCTESPVLALGGGTVMTAECAELIHEHTCCIYLRASTDTLADHLLYESAGRPMLQNSTHPAGGPSDSATSTELPDDTVQALRQRITELMTIRSSAYESTAHHIIDTDGKSIEEIAGLCAAL